jgi:TATA-box binding protein (TBP) (component of TFIID and TFIIIB)
MKAVLIRLREPDCAAMVRMSGAVTMTGCCSVPAARRAAVIVCKVIRRAMRWPATAEEHQRRLLEAQQQSGVKPEQGATGRNDDAADDVEEDEPRTQAALLAAAAAAGAAAGSSGASPAAASADPAAQFTAPFNRALFTVQTMNVRFDLRHPIRLEALHRALPDRSSYEPESFCACLVRLSGVIPLPPALAQGGANAAAGVSSDASTTLAVPQAAGVATGVTGLTQIEWRATVAVFASGKCIMMGARDMAEVEAAWNGLLPILAPHSVKTAV